MSYKSIILLSVALMTPAFSAAPVVEIANSVEYRAALQKAKKSDRIEQYRVGRYLVQGSENEEVAFDWLFLSAVQGQQDALNLLMTHAELNPLAQYALARYYCRTNEGEKGAKLLMQAALGNIGKARETLQEEALAGNVYAQLYQGHFHGESAIDSYQQAADRGCVAALYPLANAYAVEQNWSKAIEQYKIAAEKGDLNALYALATCHEEGKGTAKNEAGAFALYREAAGKGHLESQVKAGFWFAKGCEGIEKDAAQATKWYQAAADAGHLGAKAALMRIYFTGGSYAKAREIGEPIADQNGDVSYMLGQIYANAWGGVVKDQAKAFEYYLKGAELNDREAQFFTGVWYGNGTGIAQDLQKSFGWLKKAAEQGHIQAQVQLANKYEQGVSVEKNEAEAWKWRERAAERGDAATMFLVGQHYEKLGNYPEAFKWYKGSSEKGDANTHCALGRCYEEGIGVAQSFANAFNVYNKHFNQNGNGEGPYRLGRLYENGNGVRENMPVALQLYLRAGDYAKAQTALGRFHWKGLGGCAKNESTAFNNYFRNAANQGDVEAQRLIGEMYVAGSAPVVQAAGSLAPYADRLVQCKAIIKDLELSFTSEPVQELLKKALETLGGLAEDKSVPDSLAKFMEDLEGQILEKLSDLDVHCSPIARYTRSIYEASKVKEWLEKAIAQGDKQSIHSLAVLQERMVGVELAVPTYRKAAEAGVEGARSRLCKIYLKGEGGVAKNAVEAEKWS